MAADMWIVFREVEGKEVLLEWGEAEVGGSTSNIVMAGGRSRCREDDRAALEARHDHQRPSES